MSDDIEPQILSDDRDHRLADQLDRLLERRRRGEPIDLDSELAGVPDLEDELRELLTVAFWADQVANPSTESETIWLDRPSTATPRPSSREVDPWPSANASRSDDPPSSERFGDCLLLEKLGQGGMGVVYRAYHEPLGRIVALKRIRHGIDAQEEDRARFRLEVQAVAELDHPHIVPIYQVGEHLGHPYFLMKHIDGTTLSKRLADGPLPPRRAVELLLPICQAIVEAHRHGILHRDLKPSNILIDRDGTPYVTDFGLAKRIEIDPHQVDGGGDSPVGHRDPSPPDPDFLTATGAVVGTPSYMAPEQTTLGPTRQPIGPSVDVYALGAILYHMLTGRPPFQAPTAFECLLQVVHEEPVPPRALNRRVDVDLESVALTCLQKPTALRYPDASALAEDLRVYLEGRPLAARSATLRALTHRLFAETPHASVLGNWGRLWIYHSLASLGFFGLAWLLRFPLRITDSWPYLLLFGPGLCLWAALFWELRKRRGPIVFVERQLAHIWAAGVLSINGVLATEWLLGMPALTLAPMLVLGNAMLYLVKAGLLSGRFYLDAALTLVTIVPMALAPAWGLPLFTIASAWGFFRTGLHYSRKTTEGPKPSRTPKH